MRRVVVVGGIRPARNASPRLNLSAAYPSRILSTTPQVPSRVGHKAVEDKEIRKLEIA